VRYVEGDATRDFGFTGQRHDGTGLAYMHARYYDPCLNRFVSPDTIVPNPANPQGLNRYLYVYGNPLADTEPSGHSPYPPGCEASPGCMAWYDEHGEDASGGSSGTEEPEPHVECTLTTLEPLGSTWLETLWTHEFCLANTGGSLIRTVEIKGATWVYQYNLTGDQADDLTLVLAMNVMPDPLLAEVRYEVVAALSDEAISEILGEGLPGVGTIWGWWDLAAEYTFSRVTTVLHQFKAAHRTPVGRDTIVQEMTVTVVGPVFSPNCARSYYAVFAQAPNGDVSRAVHISEFYGPRLNRVLEGLVEG